ncbi:MAG: Stk1 family PASTA domain-containing Ser/Thr kinase [Micrococcales bacterium]|nr:Stk1 family PASTA domain-containing Ser/Thr kinase [Micrococcales bacterium]
MVDFTPRTLAGRYEVGELIGRGGMAEVHVGRDARLGRTVAIKVLRSDLARDPAFQNRFRREAQAAASLNHPAIVAVYDTGEDTATDPTGQAVRIPYIIMEYVEGHTLRELMRDGAALPIDEAIDITVGVLSALQYAHHSGIVHRDIKPANIMLTATGQVKVMDFGIARALADNVSTVTSAQAVIGTAQYLSPEQARGEAVDARSDLYSTGCVLFELLTGRPPFVGDSAVAVAYQHVREQPERPSALAPDVPTVLDGIVLKALSKERDLRYTTASEFRADLETAKRGGFVATALPTVAPIADPTQVLSATPVAVARPIPPRPPEPSPFPIPRSDQDLEEDSEEEAAQRKRRFLIIALVVVGIIALGAILFVLFRSGGEEAPPPEDPSPSITETLPTEPTTQIVPDSDQRMNFEEAKAALEALGFEVEPAEEPSEDVAEGYVTRYDPASGTDQPIGAVITVYVSTGSDDVEIPEEILGMSQDDARALLKELNLEPGNALPTTSATVPTTFVVETDPPVGSPAKKGDKVDLLISNGNTVVPNVKGKGEDDAKAILRGAGLTVGDTVYVLSSEPKGTVTKQSVKAKKEVPQGTQVTLTVAREPKTVTMPTVLGLTSGEAEAELARRGLTNILWRHDYSETVPIGRVISTDPAPGVDVVEGNKITILVSDGPNPAPPPPPTDPTAPPPAP